MKLLITILMLVFVVGCGSSEKVEDRTSSQSERYADFSYSAIVHYIYTPNARPPLKRKRVVFTFTPYKFGAFIIEAGTTIEKVVLSDGEFRDSVFEFSTSALHPVDSINVYWSDGTQIERTVIKINE